MELKAPTITRPEKPDNKDNVDEAIWREEIKQHVIDKKRYQKSMSNTYALIMGQCTEDVRVAIESHEDYDTFFANHDTVTLLQCIMSITYDFESHKHTFLSIHEAKKHFYTQYQSKYMSVKDYFNQFQANVEMLESIGATVGDDTKLVGNVLKEEGLDPSDASTEEVKAARTKAVDMYHSIALLHGADKTRYGRLLEDLENDHTMGHNGYPTTLNGAYNLLISWKNFSFNPVPPGPANNGVALITTVGATEGSGTKQSPSGNVNGITNATKGKEKSEKLAPDRENVTCFNCQELGHYAKECPKLNATQLLT